MDDQESRQTGGLALNGLSQRVLNGRRLLEYAWSGEPMTATELMEGTGLTRATVLSLCRDLVEAGWLRKVADARAAGRYVKGRPALRHAFCPEAAYVVGCDADEDVFTAVVADLHGEELARVRREVRALRDPGLRREELEALVDAALAAAGVAGERVAAVVIGVPAPVDLQGASPPPDDDAHYWSIANPGYADMFQDRGWMVRLDNDANLGALYEAADGAGVGARSFAVLLAAERFGAGIVVDGALLRGTRGRVGELRVLDMVSGVDAPHGLGRRTRWEIQRMADDGLLASELAELPPEDWGAEALLEAATRGDPVALEIVDRLARRLAPVVTLLTGLLDLDRIVLAGPFAASAEPLLSRTREILEASVVFRCPELVASTAGGDVVLRGAVSRAVDVVRERALLD
ncbi:ROK family transcriptional regulator [Nesterenkonia aethiopica]|uniref:ROK family protein n=2 Tax=Actinomycetes TaxID=1760 RepID=A0ABP6LPD0_9MICC